MEEKQASRAVIIKQVPQPSYLDRLVFQVRSVSAWVPKPRYVDSLVFQDCWVLAWVYKPRHLSLGI